MKKPVLYLLIILLAFCSCSNKDDSNKVIEEGCNYQPTGWDYPVKGEEFYAMGVLERTAIIQVPEGVLDTLSPEDAVRLFITCPDCANVIGLTLVQAFDIMPYRCNILRHLLSRDDVGGLLIAAYNDLDFDIQGFKTLPYCLEQNEYISAYWILLQWFQVLLSEKEILQNMTHDERLELIIEARSKAGVYTRSIMVNILYVEEYPEFMASPKREGIIAFVNGEWWKWVEFDYSNELPYDEINQMVDNFINDNKK